MLLFDYQAIRMVDTDLATHKLMHLAKHSHLTTKG